MNSQHPGRGLYQKYQVRRRMDPDHKHDLCRFFVLDPQHDEHSKVAILAYAAAVEAEEPVLAADLRRWILDLEVADE